MYTADIVVVFFERNKIINTNGRHAINLITGISTTSR